MATELDQLKRAAKKRGLIVETLGSNHERISDASGIAMIIPSTPSDHRAWNNLVADLRRTWPELADDLAPRPPKPMNRPPKELPDLMAIIEQERPTEPKILDAGNGVTVEILDIGAPLARELLTRSTVERQTDDGPITVSNRKLRTDYVVVLRRQILAGLWKDAVTTVHVAASGRLMNAQHTLTALVSASRKQPDITIRVILVTGLPEEVMSVIDTGRPRTLGDYLRLELHESYSTFLAGVLTAYGRLSQMRLLSDNRAKPTNLECLAILEDHPQIRAAVRLVNGPYKQASKLLGPSLAGALMVMMDSIEPPSEKREFGGGEQVMQELHDGASDPTGPWGILREHLLWTTRNTEMIRPSTSDKYRWVAMAWNAEQSGVELTRAQLRASKGMPPLSGFAYGDNHPDDEV